MTITTTTVPKHTVTITRDEMWKNYISSFADCAPEMPHDVAGKEVTRVLKTFWPAGQVNAAEIVNLFKEGCTFMLLGGDVMTVFDAPNVQREVVVVLGEKCSNGTEEVVVSHCSINF